MEGQNQTEVTNNQSENPKMAVVTPKNQIDFFMNNYAVYKKSGVVVIEVFFQTPDGSTARFFELTKEEFETDEFRSLANAIRKNPDQYSQREIL
jgi:hypothetical protein